MNAIGLKSDPVNTRYSWDWLFELLTEEKIKFLQLGAFFELYTMDLEYFEQLKKKADAAGVRIKSTFTAYRELGGFFYGDPFMEKAARKSFEKFIEVSAIVGADYCGSNPGAVYRDQMHHKQEGIETYLRHMKELQHFAKEKGLKGLTIEPMSCSAEPPTTPAEMDHMVGTLMDYHQENKGTTVPVYLCGDISHGFADEHKNIIHSNLELFEHAIPMMSEFHFKNTDEIYNSTFGFSPEERNRGIVDLNQIKEIIENNKDKWPVEQVIGYLELGGPKIGRDYSDKLLRDQLKASIKAIKEVFEPSLV